MNQAELKELIRVKEAELKELKKQLESMTEVNEVETMDYITLSKKEDAKEILKGLDLKDIKKICRQGSIRVIPNNKEKAISLLLDTIESRKNKGKAFM